MKAQALLVHRINEISDIVGNALAFVQAVNFASMGHPDSDLANALDACCREAIRSLHAAQSQLEAIAAEERAKEGL
jgi:hypothetical protein